VSSYLETVTAADEYRKAAQNALAKINRGRKIEKEGQDEFAAAALGWNNSGISVAQIARDTNLSETHIRNTIRLEALRRGGPGDDDTE
jgi:DNA-binding phage protein